MTGPARIRVQVQVRNDQALFHVKHRLPGKAAGPVPRGPRSGPSPAPTEKTSRYVVAKARLATFRPRVGRSRNGRIDE